MGHLHRPQETTVPVSYPNEYYYNRPQTVFGIGSGNAPPAADDEVFDSGVDSGHVTFDLGGGDNGFVLIEEG